MCRVSPEYTKIAVRWGGSCPTTGISPPPEKEFFNHNLLVRIHYIIVMIKWTGLAPWEFEFPFPISLTSTFLHLHHLKIHGSQPLGELTPSWLYLTSMLAISYGPGIPYRGTSLCLGPYGGPREVGCFF